MLNRPLPINWYQNTFIREQNSSRVVTVCPTCWPVPLQRQSEHTPVAQDVQYISAIFSWCTLQNSFLCFSSSSRISCCWYWLTTSLRMTFTWNGLVTVKLLHMGHDGTVKEKTMTHVTSNPCMTLIAVTQSKNDIFYQLSSTFCET